MAIVLYNDDLFVKGIKNRNAREIKHFGEKIRKNENDSLKQFGSTLRKSLI